MAEEEVAAAEAIPAPLDHKRKLEDLEPEAPHQADPTSDEPEKSNGEHDATPAAADEAGAKRPRLDEKPDGSGIPICGTLVVCLFFFFLDEFISDLGYFRYEQEM